MSKYPCRARRSPSSKLRAKVSLHSARVSSTISQASSWSSTRRIRLLSLFRFAILLSLRLWHVFVKIPVSLEVKEFSTEGGRNRAMFLQCRTANHLQKSLQCLCHERRLARSRRDSGLSHFVGRFGAPYTPQCGEFWDNAQRPNRRSALRSIPIIPAR